MPAREPKDEDGPGAPEARLGPRSAWLGVGALVILPAAAAALAIALMDTPKPSGSRRGPRTEAPILQAIDAGQVPGEAHPRPRRGVPALPAPAAPSPKRGSSPSVADLVRDKLAESKQFETKDPDRARRLLWEALELDPDSIPVLRALAPKLLVDEDHAKASRLARHCRSLDETGELCQQIDEQSLSMSGDVERMASSVRQCLVATPGNLDCLGGMMHYHLAKGEVSDAALYLGRLTQEAPQAAPTLFASGRLQAAGGEYAEAAKLFRLACDEMNYAQACLRAEVLTAEGW
jgi:tetratricopeptide (TPR) repeat protein